MTTDLGKIQDTDTKADEKRAKIIIQHMKTQGWINPERGFHLYKYSQEQGKVQCTELLRPRDDDSFNPPYAVLWSSTNATDGYFKAVENGGVEIPKGIYETEDTIKILKCLQDSRWNNNQASFLEEYKITLSGSTETETKATVIQALSSQEATDIDKEIRNNYVAYMTTFLEKEIKTDKVKNYYQLWKQLIVEQVKQFNNDSVVEHIYKENGTCIPLEKALSSKDNEPENILKKLKLGQAYGKIKKEYPYIDWARVKIKAKDYFDKKPIRIGKSAIDESNKRYEELELLLSSDNKSKSKRDETVNRYTTKAYCEFYGEFTPGKPNELSNLIHDILSERTPNPNIEYFINSTWKIKNKELSEQALQYAVTKAVDVLKWGDEQMEILKDAKATTTTITNTKITKENYRMPSTSL